MSKNNIRAIIADIMDKKDIHISDLNDLMDYNRSYMATQEYDRYTIVYDRNTKIKDNIELDTVLNSVLRYKHPLFYDKDVNDIINRCIENFMIYYYVNVEPYVDGVLTRYILEELNNTNIDLPDNFKVDYKLLKSIYRYVETILAHDLIYLSHNLFNYDSDAAIYSVDFSIMNYIRVTYIKDLNYDNRS